MIDYNKLKIAHELAEKYKYDKTHPCTITHHVIFLEFGGHAQQHNLILKDGIHRYADIDSLISVLRELTRPEPKYKDCWYVGSGGHPRCTKVLNQEGYAICEETDNEAYGVLVTLYPTKSQLIEAQIEYWQSLREPQDEYCNVSGAKLGKPNECQHESDGQLHTVVSFGACVEKISKCAKCGEFYR